MLFSTIGFSKKENSEPTLSEENRTLKEKVVELDKQNAESKKQIIELDKQNVERKKENEKTDTRFADFQWWSLIFLAVLAGAFTVNWVNTNNVARKQVREELKDMKDEISTKSTQFMSAITEMSTMRIEAQQTLDEMNRLLEEMKKNNTH